MSDGGDKSTVDTSESITEDPMDSLPDVDEDGLDLSEHLEEPHIHPPLDLPGSRESNSSYEVYVCTVCQLHYPSADTSWEVCPRCETELMEVKEA